MYCKNCGKEIAENARFCDACGQSVAEDVKIDAVQVETPPSSTKKPTFLNKALPAWLGPLSKFALIVIAIFAIVLTVLTHQANREEAIAAEALHQRSARYGQSSHETSWCQARVINQNTQIDGCVRINEFTNSYYFMYGSKPSSDDYLDYAAKGYVYQFEDEELARDYYLEIEKQDDRIYDLKGKYVLDLPGSSENSLESSISWEIRRIQEKFIIFELIARIMFN